MGDDVEVVAFIEGSGLAGEGGDVASNGGGFFFFFVSDDDYFGGDLGVENAEVGDERTDVEDGFERFFEVLLRGDVALPLGDEVQEADRGADVEDEVESLLRGVVLSFDEDDVVLVDGRDGDESRPLPLGGRRVRIVGHELLRFVGELEGGAAEASEFVQELGRVLARVELDVEAVVAPGDSSGGGRRGTRRRLRQGLLEGP
mmetsp:Transcript_12433/g.40679  ORF Transcript_12433/g.40679 Transcript_12433/m.40679 type:complete len:202 (+) Transcript_12433:1396-2001(+)